MRTEQYQIRPVVYRHHKVKHEMNKYKCRRQGFAENKETHQSWNGPGAAKSRDGRVVRRQAPKRTIRAHAVPNPRRRCRACIYGRIYFVVYSSRQGPAKPMAIIYLIVSTLSSMDWMQQAEKTTVICGAKMFFITNNHMACLWRVMYTNHACWSWMKKTNYMYHTMY